MTIPTKYLTIRKRIGPAAFNGHLMVRFPSTNTTFTASVFPGKRFVTPPGMPMCGSLAFAFAPGSFPSLFYGFF